MKGGASMGRTTNDLIVQDLLDILVCPLDHGTLRIAGTTLVCTICGRVYPVEDGIPNMLVEEE
jgi:uncharacterized protein YbaR (Trm112 family)